MLHMKNIIKKISVISTTIIFTVSILSGCNVNEGKVDINKSENITQHVEISAENGKALEIDKPEIERESKEGSQVIDTQTRIKNISDFNIRDIRLIYKEYNKSNNAVSTIESFLELTLKPGEVARVSASHKKYIEEAEVIKYSYVVGDTLVSVDLESDKVDIIKTNKKIVKSKKYDVLAISSPEKSNNVKGGYNSKIIIKNISENDIGSVSIIIGELNEENEYIGVTYLDSYEVIKASQELELNSVHSNNVNKIEILGYIYDDIIESRTIDINYKLSQATIIKN